LASLTWKIIWGIIGKLNSGPPRLSHHLLFSGVEIERKIKVFIVSFRIFGGPTWDFNWIK
jgi:hypothetical protein